MPNRFRDALVAQSGACNPRPLAQALVDAIGECYTEGVAPVEDPAVYLILHQLTFVLTGTNDLTDQGRWEGAMSVCQQRRNQELGAKS